MRVLEPCAGDGVFVDALNSMIPRLSIDIYELNPEAIQLLRKKYGSNSTVRITQGDTLTHEELFLLSNAGGVYERIIANPPYGGWLDYQERKHLKALYPELYVKETYALFLYRCVQLLRDNGVLVFIIPDTFLNLHRHTKLRRYLLTRTRIKEVCLFPSSFFPGVNFGYSNLCIITLEKCAVAEDCAKNVIKVVGGLRSVDAFVDLVKGRERDYDTFKFKQRDVLDSIDHALFISEEPKITYLINQSSVRIGDIAKCVTGLYSGDDKKYLRAGSKHAKNAGKYEVVDPSRVCTDYTSREDILGGISAAKHFVPIVKGGAIRYLKPDMWFMDWSVEAVNDYKTNKKARFQNTKYYFKYGIGVPMVTSSHITAALIENKLFDQSIVGIFPEDEKWTYYLLAFFNSPTCNKLIRTINPSANNSANYIKKIPFLALSDRQLEPINRIVREIIKHPRRTGKYAKQHEATLNALIETIYGF